MDSVEGAKELLPPLDLLAPTRISLQNLYLDFLGIFFPSFLASERAIATACF